MQFNHHREEVRGESIPKGAKRHLHQTEKRVPTNHTQAGPMVAFTNCRHAQAWRMHTTEMKNENRWCGQTQQIQCGEYV